jgi:predicted transcriptional regulator
MPKNNRAAKPRGDPPVSLRGPKESEDGPKAVVSFRCSRSLSSYIDEAARAPGRARSEVIISAIELDRDLAQKLRGEVQRIENFASHGDLRMHTDLAEILARLVRRGLDAAEKDNKGKNK